jgi:hypothetical protein
MKKSSPPLILKLLIDALNFVLAYRLVQIILPGKITPVCAEKKGGKSVIIIMNGKLHFVFLQF